MRWHFDKMVLGCCIVGLVLCGCEQYIDNSKLIDETGAELQTVELELKVHMIREGNVPRTLKEAIAIIVKARPDGCVWFKRGIDRWGNAYRYSFQDDLVKITSLGPNGTSDGGGVDDIQLEIDAGDYAK